jgi:hypothetical protein
METVKQVLIQIIQDQPDDAGIDEIIRALAFERMVERGMQDVRSDRVHTNQDVEKKIRQGRK